jgi:tetratricopeptide (TPR) repeat protein
MYISRIFAATAALACAAMLSSAQTRGGANGASNTGTSGGSLGGAGSVGNTGSNGGLGTGGLGSTTRGNSTTSPFPSDASRPIFLTGKVTLSDGSALAEQVLIERICNGSPHPETRTDMKGHFSFSLGQNNGMFMDASEASPSGSSGNRSNGISGPRASDLANCEIRASLPGFRSESVSLVNHRYLDNPDLGTIILHRLANVEGLTTSATSVMAPKDARKAYEKGLESVKKGKPDDAQKDFEKAVETYPKYASAWFELGRIYEQRDHVEEARKAYNQALAADSKYINPYERLYLLALKEGNWQDVADGTDRVMHLNPYDFPNAYYFNAAANLRLNKLDVAEKSARQAVELDTAHRNPKATYVLALVLAQKHNFTESAQYLNAYLKAAPDAPDAETARKQLAEIEKFAQTVAPPQPQN